MAQDFYLQICSLKIFYLNKSAIFKMLFSNNKFFMCKHFLDSNLLYR